MSKVMNQVQDRQRVNSAEIFNTAITRLRMQVWVGLVLLTGFGLIAVRAIRYLNGVTSSPPLALAMQIVLGIVLIGGLLLRNTPYVTWFQTGYLLAIGLFAPFSFIFFGGLRGLGEINIFLAVMASLLYGKRRLVTFITVSTVLSLVYVIYRELIGQPVPPFLDEQSAFFSIKLILSIALVLFSFYVVIQFYQRLLESYDNFSNEQIKINLALQVAEQQLKASSDDLLASRQRLIEAREEERRRLRRDLHDGLGPTLAAQVFRVGAARNLYAKQPAKADGFLEQIEQSVSGTVIDIKRLVDELRPPQLDRLGLADAIRDYVLKLEVPFQIVLDLAAVPDDISAATEVAAWRIVQTALDNVARHAEAATCWLTLEENDDALMLTVADNGVGMKDETIQGVGLRSMHERTEELGGTLRVGRHESGGTLVSVSLPLSAGELVVR